MTDAPNPSAAKTGEPVVIPPRVLEAIDHNLCSLHDFDPEFVKGQERFARAVIAEYERAMPGPDFALGEDGMITHPQPSLSVGLDREVGERVEKLAEVMEMGLPLTVSVQQQAESASDLRSLLALAAPAEGYVLVPVEPTEAMVTKAVAFTPANVSRVDISKVWSAMIAACLPAAPTGGRS